MFYGAVRKVSFLSDSMTNDEIIGASQNVFSTNLHLLTPANMPHTILLLLAWWPLVARAQDWCVVQPDPENVVASQLEGSWALDRDLSSTLAPSFQAGDVEEIK